MEIVMRKDTLLVHTAPKKALAGFALGLALGVAGVAHAASFYGFEDGLTGDWVGPITNVPSGGGVLGVPSAGGVRHAELTNVPDSYQPATPGSPGFGGANFSFFGLGAGPKPYAGDFFQSIA